MVQYTRCSFTRPHTTDLDFIGEHASSAGERARCGHRNADTAMREQGSQANVSEKPARRHAPLRSNARSVRPTPMIGCISLYLVELHVFEWPLGGPSRVCLSMQLGHSGLGLPVRSWSARVHAQHVLPSPSICSRYEIKEERGGWGGSEWTSTGRLLFVTS